jgi:cell wall-associated NlpC family hydrolase
MRGRVPVATGLAAAVLLLPMTSAQADPKPTIAEAQAKLKTLNSKADKIVDDYNAANEKWKKARKKYDSVNDDYKKQYAQVDVLRQTVVSIAVNTYQTGDVSMLGGVFYGSDPESALSGMAALDQLSQGRAKQLSEYEAAIQGLKDKRDQQKAAYDETAKTKSDLSKKKKDAEKLVKDQKALLTRLGAYNAGNPNSVGITYTGSASGNALTALQFAYKQVGKPYQYGATGPGSWDCSGLTQAAWAAAGVSLPRTTYEQWSWGANRRVSLSKLQPGDLLFHPGLGHVGIYAGGGKVVHAPQTGDVVKVVSLSGYGSIAGAVRP